VALHEVPGRLHRPPAGPLPRPRPCGRPRSAFSGGCSRSSWGARSRRLKYGVAEVVHAATDNGRGDENYAPFVRAIALLLDAGAADGSLKPGLDPEDVLLQLSVLWRIDPARGGEERTQRILALIVDGLRVAPDA
jgi:hypothetical protein